jgi:hypothetical protein
MRLLLFLCPLVLVAVLAGSAGAAGANTASTAGTLSVSGGKGVVTLDLRGVTLGVLTNGSLRVTDLTPHDRYAPTVTGRKLTQQRINARTVLYRGQGLRFKMIGGSYRFVARGNGIALSSVGWGSVTLTGQPKFFGDDAGVYSVDGVDCSDEPESCTPLPEVSLKIKLGTSATEGSSKSSAGAGR